MRALVAHLTTHPDVSALIGDRMHPGTLPQRTDYPAIAYVVLSEDDPLDLEGDTLELITTEVQLTVWAPLKGDCETVYQALRTALQGQSGTWAGTVVTSATLGRGTDQYDDETSHHGITAAVTIKHREQ